MSDNKLLAENTIRRFMKLANVDTMTDKFVNEKYGMAHKKDDLEEEIEDTNEEIVNEEEELEENEEVELEEEEDMEMDVDMGEVDDAPADEAPEMGAADMSLTEEEAQLLISLGERLSAAMGEEAGDEEEVADMDDMDDMADMDPEGGEEAPAKAYDSMMEDNQEDLVNEVLKRVTKRLVAEKLKNRK